MDYMQRHGRRRARPQELVPGTLRVISARMDYLPPQARDADEVLADAELGYVSRYALGRDYHKVLRRRLAQLAEKHPAHSASRSAIACSSTADRCWRRRSRATPGSAGSASTRTCINRNAGSWFFLGEILTDLPLPVDAPATAHCGTCRACIDVCPTRRSSRRTSSTRRRCISYLTIELRDVDSRSSSARPWAIASTAATTASSCAPGTSSRSFDARDATSSPRHGLDGAQLVELFAWSEAEFLARTEGSAIRRIGYECWLRNIAVALGNAPTTRRSRRSAASRDATIRQRWCASTCEWALAQHAARQLTLQLTALRPSALHVVDQPRAADARRGQHHDLARLRARRAQASRASRIEK